MALKAPLFFSEIKIEMPIAGWLLRHRRFGARPVVIMKGLGSFRNSSETKIPNAMGMLINNTFGTANLLMVEAQVRIRRVDNITPPLLFGERPAA